MYIYSFKINAGLPPPEHCGAEIGTQSPEGEREQEKGRKKRGEGEENERRK